MKPVMPLSVMAGSTVLTMGILLACASSASAQSRSMHVGIRIVDCERTSCANLGRKASHRTYGDFPTLTRSAAKAIRKDPDARVIYDPNTGLSKIIAKGAPVRWAYLP